MGIIAYMAIKTLKIRHFKRITEESTFKDLGNVNYIVGINGSGKSSVLSAISFLSNGVGSQLFSRPGTEITITGSNGLMRSLTFEKNSSQPQLIGDLRISVFMASNNSPDKAKDGSIFTDNYNDINNKEILAWINESLDMIDLPLITAEREKEEDPFKSPRLKYIQDGLEIDFRFISDGAKAFNDIRSRILSQFNTMSEQDANGFDQIFILMEEPEIFLHPTLQKAIPALFNRFIDSLHFYIKPKVCFVIATHSPFIISASSAFETQKTYIMQRGRLCDLELNILAESIGYSGNDCAFVVAQMLGADVTDLGYPENYCIIEEYSLQVILDHARNKNIIRNIQFVSASGEANVPKFKERMDNLQKLNTLIKCNPYYDNKYLIVVDNYHNFDKTQIDRFDNIRNKLKGRFIELDNLSLEDYYINLNTELYDECQKALSAENNGFKRGLIKAEFANRSLKFINDVADFKKLFNNELDSLLK